MSRRQIELSEHDEHVIIEFPYDRKLLDVVRSLPARRFNPDLKHWFVPSKHVEVVVGRLAAHEFEIGERLGEMLLEKGMFIEELSRQAERMHRPFLQEERLPPGTWTVAKLNHEVHQILKEAFREEIWIAAEIQSFDRNRRRGHAFFELVHRPYQNADPSARVSAVMWGEHREKIEQALSEDGANVRLRDGLMVRFLVKADFYTGQGRYQLSVSDIDLAYTSGTIHQNRESILRQLDEMELINLNVSKELPDVPLRVGLITSDESDAQADFIDELKSSGFGFDVGFFPSHVQGAHTERSVLGGLDYFARHAAHYDVVVIARGGGARSDLAYFDTRAIGEAVCRHPVKIVVGVGHQRDQCLLDFIAHSEKTPTAAGQAIVTRVSHYMERQYELQDRMIQAAQHRVARTQVEMNVQIEHALRVMTHRLEHYERKMERFTAQFARVGRQQLDREGRRFDRVARGIPQAASALHKVSSVKLDYAARRLEQSPRARVFDRRQRDLRAHQERLERLTRDRLWQATRRVERAEALQRLLDPKRVLERGFALVRRKEAELVRLTSEVSAGDELTIEWSDGSQHVRVEGLPASTSTRKKPTKKRSKK